MKSSRCFFFFCTFLSLTSSSLASRNNRGCKKKRRRARLTTAECEFKFDYMFNDSNKTAVDRDV